MYIHQELVKVSRDITIETNVYQKYEKISLKRTNFEDVRNKTRVLIFLKSFEYPLSMDAKQK